MATVDLSVTLAGGAIRLTSCVYNASGPRSGTADALCKIAQSQSGAVLTKSATVLAQTGNPLPRIHHETHGMASFNSEGLPNNGIDYYIDATTIDIVFPPGATTNSKLGKPYIVSLSGKSLADNITMLHRILDSPTLSRITAIELNLACPNVIGKPIIGYDMEQMEEILRELSVVTTNVKVKVPPIGVKLPPYLDVAHMKAAADVLNRYAVTTGGAAGLISYIVCINTVGNALCVEGVVSQAPYIASNEGLAGLSGPAVKYTALANVYKLRQFLPASLDIVGVGGIATGQDAYDMLLVGATACQVATQHWKEGPGCFDRIHAELVEIMRHKGFTSVTQVTGTLAMWSKDGAARLRAETKATNNTAGGAGSSNSISKSVSVSSNEMRPKPPNGTQFFMILSMILTVAVAILLADKLYIQH